MKIVIFSIVMIAMLLSVVPVNAGGRDFDTIDNAPEEKERGISAENLTKIESVIRDTPNGDKVMRILKKRLPGII